MTHSPQQAKQLKSITWICLIMSVLLVATLFFQWNLIELFTPFAAGPIIAVVGLLAVLCTLWSAIFAFRYRTEGFNAFKPLGINLIGLTIANFVPLSDLWIKANFYLKKEMREIVVEKVHAGELQGENSSGKQLIQVPDELDVSMGGNQILVNGDSPNNLIFFYTYRGIQNNYSGFLWVPANASPSDFDEEITDTAKTSMTPFSENWFFIAHR